MKSLFVVALSVLTVLPSVGFTAQTNHIQLSSAVDLAINAPSAVFRVDYPGLGKNAVCSLGLKLEPSVFTRIVDLQPLLEVKEVFINEILPIIELDEKTGQIALQSHLYVTIVSISTRDGRNLREVLNDQGIYKNSLIVTGNPCPEIN